MGTGRKGTGACFSDLLAWPMRFVDYRRFPPKDVEKKICGIVEDLSVFLFYFSWECLGVFLCAGTRRPGGRFGLDSNCNPQLLFFFFSFVLR